MSQYKVAAILTAALALGAPVRAAEKPNILVIFSDDHGYLDSTVYGATDVRTPNLERLAKEGVAFTHMFAPSPSCSPSRTAMLTGLMPARNGAERNHALKKPGIPSLIENLRKQGYEVAAFGKVAHYKDGGNHDFDLHDDAHDARTVENFLKNRTSGKPLCLFVGTHEPHVPWPDLAGYDPARVKLPPTHIDTPETRDFRCRYYTDITKADSFAGAMSDLAKKYLGAKNTLTIYTSDHGAQWPFGKWNLYDAGIRVPFIAVWPGVIKSGTKSEAMCSWIDLLPTLIDVAGGPVPKEIDGKSFLPVLTGQSAKHRDRIFATHTGDGEMNVYPIRCVRTRDWKYILNLHPEFVHGTHIDRAKDRDGLRYFRPWIARAKTDPAAAAIVKRYYERPREELYDIPADPFEMKNLADDPKHAERLGEFRKQVENWMKEQGDPGTVFGTPRLLKDLPKGDKP
jgi:arylsulfatase A-like enzyme